MIDLSTIKLEFFEIPYDVGCAVAQAFDPKEQFSGCLGYVEILSAISIASAADERKSPVLGLLVVLFVCRLLKFVHK